MNIKCAILAQVLISLFFVAGPLAQGNALESSKPVEPGPVPEYARNAAGFAIFRTLANSPQFLPNDGNLVLSPASIEPVLLALEIGAGGQSAEQLAKILRPEGEPLTPFRTERGDGKALISGLPMWIADRWPARKECLATLQKHLKMEHNTLDFVADPTASATRINQWVSRATRDWVESLFEPSELDARTRLVLVSDLAYDGVWVNPFDAKKTEPATFRTGNGEEILIPFMHLFESLPYAEAADGTRVHSLALEDGKQRCVFFLLKEGPDPGAARNRACPRRATASSPAASAIAPCDFRCRS